MPTAAAIYCRISDDREGAGLGVQRQERDCRDLCERRGWEVAEVYVDNDLSAYNGKPRASYERMIADLEAGRRDALVCWHVDRLTRRPRELEDVIDLHDQARFEMATVTGDIDLGSHTGQLIARNLGAAARYESDQKSSRTRRKMEQMARAGEGKGGGTRPYGFKSDRVTIDAAEAAIIREAADRILLGETLRTIVRDFEAREIRSVTGRPWSATVLRRILVAPRTAGLREHHGVVVAKANWSPIVDETTHKRLKVILEDPKRLTNGGSNARSYLLTGYLYCALCERRLVARPRGDKRRCYVCASGPGFNGCGKIRVLAEPLEDLIRDAVIEALDSPALTAALASGGDQDVEHDLFERMRADEDALEQLARDFYAERVITRPEYMAARAAVEARIDKTKIELSRLQGGRAFRDVPRGAEAVRKAWDERDLGWRRALLGAVIEKVVVGSAVRGLNRFDPARVEFRWRV